MTQQEIDTEVERTHKEVSAIIDRWEKSIGLEKGRHDDDPLVQAFVGLMFVREALTMLYGQALVRRQQAVTKEGGE